MNLKKKKVDPQSIRKQKVQDWFPLEDIRDGVMYVKDKSIAMAIRVMPINIFLLSQREIENQIQAFFECINGIDFTFQIFTIGRPVDLDLYIESLNNISKDFPNGKRKHMLNTYIRQASTIAAGGSLQEVRYYIIVSSKNIDIDGQLELRDKCGFFKNSIFDSGLTASICDDRELFDMVGNYSQPVRCAVERFNTNETTIPFYEGGLNNGK